MQYLKGVFAGVLIDCLCCMLQLFMHTNHNLCFSLFQIISIKDSFDRVKLDTDLCVPTDSLSK